MITTNNQKTGYVYILQNDAHDPYIIKIGLTRHDPNRRAKQIYWGATGVPLKFNIAIAFSVGDCVLAEKTIHEMLDTFRPNPRREFFKIKPSIAAAIAQEVCTNINKKLGISKPEQFKFTNEKATTFLKEVPDVFGIKDKPVVFTKISDLTPSPVGTSTLSTTQINRIRIIHAIFYTVFPIEINETVENFTRDHNPETEIIIWENAAKVFQSFDALPTYNDSQKKEAFRLILSSTFLPETEMDKLIKNSSLDTEAIKFIQSKIQTGSI